MVDIEIDGIYCSRCNTLHPTLFWHKKYKEYMNRHDYYEERKKACERFRMECSDESCEVEYQHHLALKKIKLVEQPGNCAVCGTLTNFIDVYTETYVCSDECAWEIRKNNEEGETVDE